MTEKTLLKKSIGNALNGHGFRRRGQSWFLDGSECIFVFNLQKDDYSELYFVNIGIWLKSLGNEEHPPAHKCHIHARIEELFPKDREMILDACTVSPDNSDLPAFLAFLSSYFIPFAKLLLTQDGLVQEIKEGRIPTHYINLAGKVALGLTRT